MNAMIRWVGLWAIRWRFGWGGAAAVLLVLSGEHGVRGAEGAAGRTADTAASAPGAEPSAPSVGSGLGGVANTRTRDEILARRYGEKYGFGGGASGVANEANARGAGAATDSSQEESLKQGLWLEEAKRDLAGAIPHYQRVLVEFDALRTGAAIALFRLGECQRKLGQTNEAAAAYRRLVREFGDQESLTKLAAELLESWGLQEGSPATTEIDPNTGQPVLRPGEALVVDPNTGMLVATRLGEARGKGAVPNAPAGSDSLPRWRHLDPGELPRLRQELAFLERKKAAGDPEAFASALQLVFREDPFIGGAERSIRHISADLADRALIWSKAEGEQRRLTAELAKARVELEALERAVAGAAEAQPPRSARGASIRQLPEDLGSVSAAGNRSRSGNAELDEKFQQCMRLERELNVCNQSLAQRDYQHAMQAFYEVRLAERREELMLSARLRVRVLEEFGRALQMGGGDASKGWEGLLGMMRNASNVTQRSTLMELTLEDKRLEQLRRELLQAREQAADRKARQGVELDTGRLGGVQEMVTRSEAELRAREDEVLRLLALHLELLQANVK